MLKELSNTSLYHGSSFIAEDPDLKKCKKGKDFGQGFYLTTDKRQATSYSKLVARRIDKEIAFVNEYDFRDFAGLKVHEFTDTDKNWLHCIIGNRNSYYQNLSSPWDKYDVLIGKIADDDTSHVINAYMAGAYGPIGSDAAVNFAVSMFKSERLKKQICLKSPKALKCIVFKDAVEVTVK